MNSIICRISPGIQSAVDQYFAQKKAEADEIEKKGDESRLHEMGPMMEKGQYDVMKKNFRWGIVICLYN